MSGFVNVDSIAAISEGLLVEARGDALNVYDRNLGLHMRCAKLGKSVLLSEGVILQYTRYDSRFSTTKAESGQTETFETGMPLERVFFHYPLAFLQFEACVRAFNVQSAEAVDIPYQSRLFGDSDCLVIQTLESLLVFNNQQRCCVPGEVFGDIWPHYGLLPYNDKETTVLDIRVLGEKSCSAVCILSQFSQYWLEFKPYAQLFECIPSETYRRYVCSCAHEQALCVVSGGAALLFRDKACVLCVELMSDCAFYLKSNVWTQAQQIYKFQARRARVCMSHGIVCVYSGNVAFCVDLLHENAVYVIDCGSCIWDAQVIGATVFLSTEGELHSVRPALAEVATYGIGQHAALAEFAGRLVVGRLASEF